MRYDFQAHVGFPYRRRIRTQYMIYVLGADSLSLSRRVLIPRTTERSAPGRTRMFALPSGDSPCYVRTTVSWVGSVLIGDSMRDLTRRELEDDRGSGRQRRREDIRRGRREDTILASENIQTCGVIGKIHSKLTLTATGRRIDRRKVWMRL